HWRRSALNVFSGIPSRSSFGFVRGLGRCRSVSGCLRSCCAPENAPDWPARLGGGGNPRLDSPQPFAQPKRQFPTWFSVVPWFETSFRRISQQSIFDAKPTKSRE